MIPTRELLTALASMLAGSMLTYCIKAVSLEGRMDGMEHAVSRIEEKLDRLDERMAKK